MRIIFLVSRAIIIKNATLESFLEQIKKVRFHFKILEVVGNKKYLLRTTIIDWDSSALPMIKLIFLLVFTFLSFISCNRTVECKRDLSDEILYRNYAKAIKNGSTIQNFIVIKVKNLNNGEVREYCTKGNFLIGALHREFNLGYSKKEIVKVYETALGNKDRYFEFKNDSALLNVSAFKEYSMKELCEFEKQIEIDSLIYKIKSGKNWGFTISNDKEMKMVAHALFNKGILTGENSCFGGVLLLDEYE